MISSVFRALRVGASVQNTKGTKWAGFAAMAAIIILNIAKANGVLSDVQEKEFVDFTVLAVESVLALFAAYSQLATTEKIGLLPPADRDPRIDERLRDQSVPTRSDETEPDRKSGFPEGPFWDN